MSQSGHIEAFGSKWRFLRDVDFVRKGQQLLILKGTVAEIFGLTKVNDQWCYKFDEDAIWRAGTNSPPKMREVILFDKEHIVDPYSVIHIWIRKTKVLTKITC